MQKSVYALIIVAHPDDESFLFAGTTLKLEEQDKNVVVICATRGEKGADRLNRNLNSAQMAKIRTSELLKACGILHCQCRKFFKHLDGGLEKDDFDQLVLELSEEINFHQPQIIMTFGEEGISGHKDHITIGKAAMQASKQARPQPKEIWLASIPASLAGDFQEHTEKRKVHHRHFIENKLTGVADDKLTKIDVSKYQDLKLEAIKAHQSQYVPDLIWPKFFESEWFEVISLP